MTDSAQSMSSDHAVSLAGESDSSHQAFVKALVAGHEIAWDGFHQRYSHRLQAYLRALWNGPEHHLDDLLQLTLLRAVKYIKRAESLESEDAFWCWLTVLARSAVADHGRKTSRFLRFLQRFHLEPKSPTPPESGDLRTAMEKLDPGTRQLLQLKYEDQLSVREIAHQLGCSEKSIESRLTRARKKLRKLLQA